MALASVMLRPAQGSPWSGDGHRGSGTLCASAWLPMAPWLEELPSAAPSQACWRGPLRHLEGSEGVCLVDRLQEEHVEGHEGLEESCGGRDPGASVLCVHVSTCGFMCVGTYMCARVYVHKCTCACLMCMHMLCLRVNMCVHESHRDGEWEGWLPTWWFGLCWPQVSQSLWAGA